MVPLIPSLIISRGKHTIAELVPDTKRKRYEIRVRTGVTAAEVTNAAKGTVRTDGRGQDPYLIHSIGGIEYRTKISTLRGDYCNEDGTNCNRLRLWEKHEFRPGSSDIFQERLYAIHWMRPKSSGKSFDYEFRAVGSEDLKRERIVEDYVSEHLVNWQKNGWLPDMRIEPGAETTRLLRERGWTHWHHLFNSRQLLVNGLISASARHGSLTFAISHAANRNSKLSRWDGSPGVDAVHETFDNQALNPLFNYGSRSTAYISRQILAAYRSYPLPSVRKTIGCHPAGDFAESADIFITDPPYGDAVNYDEILDFFIAWLRKNPPREFSEWVWDSRRSLAIKGEGEDFRRGMVAAYKRMTEFMPDNGIQVIMFTHQSGSIWADMANIVWASGLQVTAAWYVVTETDNVLREGSYVKGTVLLVLRKRHGTHKTTRDELAWEIQELSGLNQQAKGLYRDSNVFEDADIQMAGYAAALRVLTRYSVIDGRDMTTEAIRPRVKGKTTFVDGLIEFSVATANQCLVPQGVLKSHWDKLGGAERFYLKLLDMEARGAKTLDNYQNFAKAFKVHDFKPLLASQKANDARLKSAVELGRAEMSDGSELHQSVLRAVLYAVMELVNNVDGNDVLAHLTLNIANYYGDMTQRELAVELADYLAKRLDGLRIDEASAARVLRELVKNQRLG
jgi:putative DNA methylase